MFTKLRNLIFSFLKLFSKNKNILVIEYDILPQMVRVERIYPNSLEFLLIKE